MGGDNVGSIEYTSRLTTDQLKKDAAQADKIVQNTGENISNSMESSEGRASKALRRLGTTMKVATAAGAAAVATSMTLAAKASWDQVSAVEQATVGLRAYEKDGAKVNAVLEDLIKYARSDMGVLFNRKDLFQSAQMLKLNGVSTKDLSNNVQILSRSVGLGLGNWQDLNAVVGRVVATGRLSGIEFDQLTQYGFKLDKSLRNTDLTAKELFKTLDKGIPVDAMEGQANTIRGIGIRIQTAFRGVGDAILGVDADTSKFVEDGLGYRLVNGVISATSVLKQLQPVIANTATNMLNLADKTIQIASKVGAVLAPELNYLKTNLLTGLIPALTRLWKEVLQPLAPVIGTTLVIALLAFINVLTLATQGTTILTNAALDWIQAFRDGNPVVVGLTMAVAGFLATIAVTKGIMAFGAALNLLSTVTIPAVMARVTALRVLVATPMIMPALAIGAALASIALVLQKWRETKAVIEETQANIASADASREAGIKSLRDTARTGNAAQRQRAIEALNRINGRYQGGPVSANQPYLVGENRDGSMNNTTEMFVPRSAGNIINSRDLQGMMGGGGSSFEYNIGTINIDNEADGEKWLNRLTQNQEIISKGLTPRQAYQ